MKSIYENFDALKDMIKNNHDFFNAPIICFPSKSIEQWFKVNYLKTEDSVLMNVETFLLSKFIIQELNKTKQYHVIDQDILTDLFISYLIENSENLCSNIKNYIYENGVIDSVKIYDIASELSNIYFKYEEDCYIPNGFEKDLFDDLMKYAKEYGYVSFSYLLDNYEINNFSKKLIIFGFSSFTKLEQKVLNKFANNFDITYFNFENDETHPSIKVMTAPSILREVEYVHSSICSLLNSDNLNYSDIVVYAPDITKYASTIKRIFTQDNVKFPNLSYVIDGISGVDDNVYHALDILFNIINKKSYTRFDFYSLVSNNLIKDVYDLTDDDIDAFIKIITNMNIYRATENNNDFTYAKMRLNLSKLLPNDDHFLVDINQTEYISYEQMDVTDTVITKFNKIVNNLESFYNNFATLQEIDKSKLAILKQELDKWFIKEDESYINKSYKEVLIRLNRISYLLNHNMPINTLIYCLLASSTTKTFNKKSLISSGITFTNIRSGYIPSKYAFIMGLSSNEFPKSTMVSELDERTDIISREEEDKKSFNNILNCSSYVYLSYVNRNLKTDETYYPSILIPDNIKEESITIDEERSWDNLFTKREYKQKDYYLALLEGSNFLNKQDAILKPFEPRKTLRPSDFVQFLEEPLIYKANVLFKQYNDNILEMKDEYEPIELSKLIKAICLKELSKGTLLGEFQDVIKKWNLQHVLLNNDLDNIKIEFIKKLSENIVEFIKTKEFDADYEFLNFKEPEFSYNDFTYRIIGEVDVVKYINGLNRCYKEIKEIKTKVDDKDFLNLYICSLIDISQEESDSTYLIRLKKSDKFIKEYHITPSEAKSILNKLHEYINDYDDLVYIPINVFSKDYDKYSSVLYDLKYVWKYKDNNKLFNLDTDLGFNNDDFLDVLSSKKQKILPLIKFLDQVEEN